MHNSSKSIEILNDLIRINNDRLEGYERAIMEAKAIDPDLHEIFKRMIEESIRYKNELIQAIQNLGGFAEPCSTTNTGKIYRVWTDIKSFFTDRDRMAVLESCEFGEDAAQKAYLEALASEAAEDAGIRELISRQKSELKSSQDLIKSYCEIHAAVKEQIDKLASV